MMFPGAFPRLQSERNWISLADCEKDGRMYVCMYTSTVKIGFVIRKFCEGEQTRA